MRVLHVIDHWGLGGAQRALAALVRHEQRHEHAIASVFEHQRQDWELPAAIPLWFLAKSYPGGLGAIFHLRRHIQRWRPDVIQVHLNGARFMTELALWRLKPRPVVIWHEHSGRELLKIYGRVAGGFLMRWQRRLLARVAHVVGNSESTLSYLAQCLGVLPEQASLIHCPVDSAHIRKRAADQLDHVPKGVKVSGAVVGFIGRLVDQKGPEDLVRVADALRESDFDGQLWVVGDGPMRGKLEARIRAEGLAGQVVFWGNRRDVYAILQAMTLVIMPSRYEPFGLVAMEAFVLGKPVVAYAVDGLAEVLALSPLGTAVKPLDVESLVQAMFSVLQNREAFSDITIAHPFEPVAICKSWDLLYSRLRAQDQGGS